MAEDLGTRLIGQGWRQGSLFGPLSHLLHFNLEEPLRIPKGAVDEARAARESSTGGEQQPSVGQAVRLGRAKDRWVLITQECDLVKGQSIEPYVVAIRCFQTENDKVLHAAANNSSYYFLLDRDLGLVADAREQIQLEKPALLEFAPVDAIRSDEGRWRFARWLARRVDRPVVPDHIVEAFVSPLLDLLKQLRDTEPASLECLEKVHEIRFRAVGETLLEVDLLFIVDREDLPEIELGLARLVARMLSSLDDATVRLTWEAPSLDDISVRDYIATDQLYLDNYTLRGETRVGLGPPPRL